MSLRATAYAIGRALAGAAPDSVQRRLLKIRRLQSGIWHLPEQRIVYVVIPKVATRSVLAALTTFAAGEETVERGGSRAAVTEALNRYQRGAFPPEIRRLARTCFTFAFVRNPLDRLLSAYTQQMAAIETQKTIFRQHDIPFDVSFSGFVEAIASIPDEGCDHHVRSQHSFIADGDGLMVEYLGRFERLEEDWKALVDRFGFPALPRRHASSHAPYTEAYTPALARLAAERYSRDIELLGYEEEVARLTR